MERSGSDFYLTLKPIGKLTHEDYEIISPMLDSAVEGVKHPKIKVLIDASETEGWEPRAAWDDFKLGIKHGRQFDKIAIVGNDTWPEMVARLGGWFIAGETKFFDEIDDALEWLND
jgi:hypothetical protein